MSDLMGLFNDLIRFEIELWNAVDARLKSEFSLPLTHFEPMSVIDKIPGCRVYDIANELGITTGEPASWWTGSRPAGTAAGSRTRTTDGRHC